MYYIDLNPRRKEESQAWNSLSYTPWLTTESSIYYKWPLAVNEVGAENFQIIDTLIGSVW